MSTTRAAVVQAIQTFYDAEVLGYYPINQNTISDIKDGETKQYKRCITIGGYCFNTRLGVLYHNMKSRSKLGGSMQKNQPYYLGTVMCAEWAESFDSFAEWCQSQIGMYQVDERGCFFELDKDLLGNGKKFYSPDTCTMLPKLVNSALAASGSRGYQKTLNGKWQVKLCKFGKVECIGTYDSEKEARAAYKKARRGYLKELAKKYKHQIEIRAYDALMTYKQH